MIIEHFFIANDSSIDLHKNSLSIFGIVEDLQISRQSAETQIDFPCHIILIGCKENEVGEVRENHSLTLHGPNGNIIGISQQVPFHIQAQNRRNRVRVITRLPLSVPGEYRVVVTSPTGATRFLSMNVTFTTIGNV